MELELNPVSRITTGAVGPPGRRVFYIQARKEDHLVSLIIEKHQVISLAIGLEEFLKELDDRLPDLPEASAEYDSSEMELEEPLDPMFRVGQIGLAYDEESDRLVLIARQLESEDEGTEVVRIWCTRSQLSAMCAWGMELASRGRPICGNCGEPKDPEGHFCPKSNGHKI
jgi:uncharacterized repeat protein (TIGR03847 family)